MSRRKYIVAAGAAAAAVTIGGAAYYLSQRGGQPPPTTGSLLYYDWTWLEEKPKQWLTNARNRFKAKHPEIDLTIEGVASTEYREKILRMVTAGNAPSGCMLWDGSFIREFIDMGAIIPIDDYFTKDLQDKFFPASYGAFVYKDHVWGTPSYPNHFCCWYNKKMFRDNGVEEPPAEGNPWSVEEFIAAAKACTKGDVWGFAEEFYRTIYGFNDWYYAHNGRFFDGDGVCIINGPEGVQTLELIVSLRNTHKCMYPDMAHSWEIRTMFTTEKVAIIFDGSWVLPQINKENPNLEFGTALMPRVGNNPVTTRTACQPYVIFTQCKKPEVIFDFEKELWLSDQGQKEAVDIAGYLPNRQNWEDLGITLPAPFTTLMNEFQWCRSAEAMPNPLYTDNRIVTAVQEALFEIKTPKQALDDAAKDINAVNMKETKYL
jgi:ABC-type glycerol-3-phosphate transport system substrate-binding protein